MSLDASLLSHCHAIVHRIAPELRGVHIVPDSVFEGLAMPPDCRGFAIESEHLTFDISERLPEHTSTSPVIVLCPNAIREDSSDDAFRDGVMSVLLHEAAHLLPRPVAAGRISPPDFSYLDCAAVRARLDERRAKAIALPEPSPDAEDAVHGWRFLRRVCHLWSRARLAGWDVPTAGLLGNSFWYCSQEAHWVMSLFSELVRLRNATFCEIESTEPPKEFMSMWQHALSTFYRFRGTQT